MRNVQAPHRQDGGGALRQMPQEAGTRAGSRTGGVVKDLFGQAHRDGDTFRKGSHTLGMTHRGDPETSLHAAADQVATLNTVQERVLELFDIHFQMTDEELHQHYQDRHGPCGYSTARQRRVELRDLGRIRDSGKRRQTALGKDAVVWELAVSR